MQRVNQKVSAYAILMLILALPALTIMHPHLFREHRLTVSCPVHSVMEAVGAIAALFMGFLSVQWLSASDAPRYIFISLGFICMGTLDLFHAMLLPGKGFVLLHALAVFIGGALYSLVWISASDTKTYLSYFKCPVTKQMRCPVNAYEIFIYNYPWEWIDERNAALVFADFDHGGHQPDHHGHRHHHFI